MSRSLLYRAFGVRGYWYRATKYSAGKVSFCVEAPREKLVCPKCGSGHVHILEHFRRRWRNVPIGGLATWIEMKVPKVECQECFARRRVPVQFAEPHKRHTRAFQRYVEELLRYMTPQDISRHLDISWDLANDIQKRRLQRKFSRPKLKHLKRLAVDEVYVGKRHKYLTLVLDRFHVVKLYNEKLTKLRRELYREATDMLQKNVLKGTRWLLLMNAENLNEERDEPSRLEQALLLNAPLAKAYYLKDELRQFWKQDSKPVAERHLDSWCTQAEQTGIRVLQQMAKTLRKHRASLLAWYDDPISTGPLEGVNNKLKLMQREAFGYRDLELLKLRILSLHTTHKSLVR